MARQVIPFDVETSTLAKGNPYNTDNRLVAIGIDNYLLYKNNWDTDFLQHLVDTSILVGHNIKFDIAWLRTIGVSFNNAIIRDTQLAEFLLSNQTKPFVSLEELAIKYLDEHKLDVVKTDYWDKGIDTWFIPEDILLTYLKQDLNLTIQIYNMQEKLLKKENKWNLYLLQCADLLELQEMEWNGILLDKESCLKKGDETLETITEYKKYISSFSICPNFNCSSGDHLSCLLYGGTIIDSIYVDNGFYKTGKKAGFPKYKIITNEYKQEQLFVPIKGSELKKEGYYSVDENTLMSLKTKNKEHKKLIDTILKLAKLEKLVGTYFHGIPKKMNEFGWKDNYIHGQLNQVVARTGRTSSSNPNQQNLDPEFKKLCVSRYEII